MKNKRYDYSAIILLGVGDMIIKKENTDEITITNLLYIIKEKTGYMSTFNPILIKLKGNKINNTHIYKTYILDSITYSVHGLEEFYKRHPDLFDNQDNSNIFKQILNTHYKFKIKKETIVIKNKIYDLIINTKIDILNWQNNITINIKIYKPKYLLNTGKFKHTIQWT